MQASDFAGIIVVSLLALGIGAGKIGYDLGYNDARADFTRPIEYKCIDGYVYRSRQTYLEHTSQKCKILDEVKQ